MSQNTQKKIVVRYDTELLCLAVTCVRDVRMALLMITTAPGLAKSITYGLHPAHHRQQTKVNALHCNQALTQNRNLDRYTAGVFVKLGRQGEVI
jgi:hypothetical protein